MDERNEGPEIDPRDIEWTVEYIKLKDGSYYIKINRGEVSLTDSVPPAMIPLMQMIEHVVMEAVDG